MRMSAIAVSTIGVGALVVASWLVVAARRGLLSHNTKATSVTLVECRHALEAGDLVTLQTLVYSIIQDSDIVPSWPITDRRSLGRLLLGALVQDQGTPSNRRVWLDAMRIRNLLGGEDLAVVLSDKVWDGGFSNADPILRLAVSIWRYEGRVSHADIAASRCLDARRIGVLDEKCALSVLVPTYSVLDSADLRLAVARVIDEAVESVDDRLHLQLALEFVRWGCVPKPLDQMESLVNEWARSRFVIAIAAASVLDSRLEHRDWVRANLIRILVSRFSDRGALIARVLSQYGMVQQGLHVEMEAVRSSLVAMAGWSDFGNVDCVGLIIAIMLGRHYGSNVPKSFDSARHELEIRLEQVMLERSLC